MATPSTKGTAAPNRPVAPDDYAAFIRQIELVTIWLHQAHVMNTHGPEPPKEADVNLRSDAHWEIDSGGFRAFHRYEVELHAGDAVFARIEVTFGLRFASNEPMTDEIFTVFKEVNLPVNSWPYLREFIASTTGRMGWLPITLPALKLGISSRRRGRGRPGQTSAVRHHSNP